MNTHERIPEASLTAGLADLAGPSTPGLRDEILAAAAQTRQRPAWSFLERWLPMAVITRPMAAPAVRPLWLLLMALLLTILAAGGLIVGASLLRSDATIPMGGAAVLVFDATDGEIYTIRADGTDLRRLTDGPGVASAPAWSPDGTRIAYRLTNGSDDSIIVMDAGGTNGITVAAIGPFVGSCDLDVSIAWSPDGTALVIPASASCPKGLDPLIVRSDGTSPAVRLLAPGTQGVSASWSPDGSRIAFQGRDDQTGTTGLYLVDIAGADVLAGGFTPRRIADGSGPVLDQAYSAPAWSPDGTEVAAVVGTQQACYGEYTAMTWDIVLVDVRDGTQRPLTTEPGDEMSPTWSPDGQRIAFHRTVDPAEYFNDRPCTVRTWVADRDGTNAREIAYLEDHWPAPAWSPDGTRLLGTLVNSELPEKFQFAVIPVDEDETAVALPNASGSGSWQPKAVPLPIPPSFPAGSATP